MAPVLIDSSSSDEELFAQLPGQNFKLKPTKGVEQSSSSAFRPIRPKGKVLGARLGQYRDETSSSEEDDLDAELFNSAASSPGDSNSTMEVEQSSRLIDIDPPMSSSKKPTRPF